MNRFQFALAAAFSPRTIPLLELAQQFALAVEQCEGEDLNPTEDPSILLLGAFIAFRTDADVNTNQRYMRLLERCEDWLAKPRTTN